MSSVALHHQPTSAIQVITPEGYKLLDAAASAANGASANGGGPQPPNGATVHKPLTITLAAAGGGGGEAAALLAAHEKGGAGENGEEGVKGTPMMVAVGKNGVSALHLAVPASHASLQAGKRKNNNIKN